MGRISKVVWIHNLPQEGPEAVRIVARRLAEAGINLLIPCIKNVDGYIDYHGTASHITVSYKITRTLSHALTSPRST